MYLTIELRIMDENYSTHATQELKLSGSYNALLALDLGASINQMRWDAFRSISQDEDEADLPEETDDVP